MGLKLTGSSSQYWTRPVGLTRASFGGQVTGPGLTFSAWVRTTGSLSGLGTGASYILGLGSPARSGLGAIFTDLNSGIFVVDWADTTTSGQYVFGNNFSTSWVCVVAILQPNGKQAFYTSASSTPATLIQGANAQADPETFDSAVIGWQTSNAGFGTPTPSNLIQVAEFAIWKGTLGSAEALKLFSGENPLNIQSGSLYSYYPLRTDLNDLGPQHIALTPVGGAVASFVDHPRVQQPRLLRSGFLIPTSSSAISVAGNVITNGQHIPNGASGITGGSPSQVSNVSGSTSTNTITLNWTPPTTLGVIVNATHTPLGAVAINGNGNVAVSYTTIEAGRATIPGVGNAAASTTQISQASIILNAVASVGVAATHTPNGSITVGPIGTIIVDATHNPNGVVLSAGSGSIIVGGDHTPLANLTIIGVGSIAPYATILDTQSSIINNGSGGVLINATHTPLATLPIFSIIGNVSTNTTTINSISSIVLGNATVSVKGNVLPGQININLSGSGSVTVNSTTVAKGSSTLSGTSTVSIINTATLAASSLIAGISNNIASADHTVFGNILIAGAVSTISNGINAPPGWSILSGGGNVFISQVLYYAGANTAISGTTNVAVDSVLIRNQTLNPIAGSGSLTASSNILLTGRAALTGNSTAVITTNSSLLGFVTSSGQSLVGAIDTALFITANSTLPAVASVVTTAIHPVISFIIINGSSTVTTSAFRLTPIAAIINASGSVAINASHSPLGNPGLNAAGVVTATTTQMMAGNLPLAGVASVSINADHSSQDSPILNGVTNVIVNGVQINNASVNINGNAELISDSVHDAPMNVNITGDTNTLPINSKILIFASAQINGNSDFLSDVTIRPAQSVSLIQGKGTAFLHVNIIHAPLPEHVSDSRIIKIGRKVLA